MTIFQNMYIGLSNLLISFALLYFAYYALQISTNEKEIKEIKKWHQKIEERFKTIERLTKLELEIERLKNE